jgi:uncharacterized protein YbjT (DUF2867 family)
MNKILVIGATGRVAGLVLPELVQRNAMVPALTASSRLAYRTRFFSDSLQAVFVAFNHRRRRHVAVPGREPESEAPTAPRRSDVRLHRTKTKANRGQFAAELIISGLLKLLS